MILFSTGIYFKDSNLEEVELCTTKCNKLNLDYKYCDGPNCFCFCKDTNFHSNSNAICIGILNKINKCKK